MIKLYKKDSKGNLHYAEYWLSDNEITLHWGQVGRTGKTEVHPLGQYFNTEEDFIAFFEGKYKSKGYLAIPDEETCFLAVQFPMKSLFGNKRDAWLRDKVTDYLDDELGWKGLGHVEGFDMGKLIVGDKKFALTIFCLVVDEAKGIKAIKSCLRYARLDANRIKIASRPYLSNGGFELQYSAIKNDTSFSL